VNREVARLLSEAGVSTRVGWQDVIVVQNYAPVPPPAGFSAVESWNRGFNLVVLDRGAPKHFCKCRPAGNAAMEREVKARMCLQHGGTGGLSVPPARNATGDRIMVQASPFVRGSHYGRVAPKQSADDYLETVRRMMSGLGELADIAQSSGFACTEDSQSIALAEASKESLEHVAGVMRLEGELLEALSHALEEAGRVPARPQHGDFWWRNLLLADRRIWAIDFEHYGLIQVPLYDDLTLLAATAGLRSGHGHDGLEALAGPGVELLGCREALTSRAFSEGLGSSQLDGAVAYYAVHMSSSVHRRAGPTYAAPHLANVRYIAERLAAGDRHLLFVD